MHFGVFCKKTVITKSTRFGPYPGKSVNPAEAKTSEDNNHMWEIFNDGRLSHFVDGKLSALQQHIKSSQSLANNNTNTNLNSSSSTSSSSSSTNNNTYANQWMIYVNCARFAQEQNLIAVQSEGEIYYEVCKDIAQVINFTFFRFCWLLQY